MTSSHPRLSKTFKAQVEDIRNAAELPSLPLPADLSYPALPSSSRAPSSFAPGYTVTTHIVPGAFPRYSYEQPRKYALTSGAQIVEDAPPDSASKRAKQKWGSDKRHELVQKGVQVYESRVKRLPEDGPGSAAGSGPVVWNVVNRYAPAQKPSPADNRAGLTVLAWHANGMHKETWEPTFQRLFQLGADSKSQVRIDEIWSFEAANTGDSALLNQNKFDDFVDWIDHVRDLLNFTENYLPSDPHDPHTPLPTHLKRLDTKTSSGRAQHGIENKFLVALGHSFGGCVLANAACVRPKLFRSLTLVEPVLFHELDMEQANIVFVAVVRRQYWRSREEAKSTLSKNPFFAAWKPEVLDLYVQYALCDAEDGGVRLKMPRFQEAVSFSHATTSLETWDMLERLDEHVRLRWIMAETPSLGSVEDMHHMVWRRQTNASNVIIRDSHHLLVQEAPEAVAQKTFTDWNEMLNPADNKYVQAKL